MLFYRAGIVVGLMLNTEAAAAKVLNRRSIDVAVACHIVSIAVMGAFLPETFKKGMHDAESAVEALTNPFDFDI
ncbi:hypothetical protein H6758_01715 [Candidatus Nomurabacteria bacterium]|nr:hypothetical protein [Candidatus Nomurabacteria bacterium]